MKLPELILTSCLLFTTFFTSFGTTYIRDGENISGTWTTSGSPYIIEGEATVPKGRTLTIRPGVVVKLKADYPAKGIIYVKGKLKAIGTANNWIEFTKNEGGGDDDYWGAILFIDSKYGNQLKHCKISYAGYISPKFEGANSYYRGLSFHNSSADVSYCILNKNKEVQIQCTANSNPTLKNLTIVNNTYNPGLYTTGSDSKPTVINCIIYKNSDDIGGGSHPNISYSLVGEASGGMGSEAVIGSGVIFNGNPRFVDVDNGDFRLRRGSPCIGSGKYGADMGAIPFGNSDDEPTDDGTVIRDGQKVYGTWRLSNSPYILKGSATVPKGRTLTIEPGVIVKLKTGDNRNLPESDFDLGYLRVNGTIKANGSDSQPIRFTRLGDEGNWGAVHLTNSKNYNTFKYCIFEYGYGLHSDPDAEDWSFGGQLSAFASTLRATNCTFSNGRESATYFIEAEANFVNCIFDGNIAHFGDDNNINVSYSAFSNDADDYSGDNNIVGSSLSMNDDYSLRSGSPCIGSGKYGTDMGAIPFNKIEEPTRGGTIIRDGQEIYGTWRKSGSPYIIKGEATVPDGKSLTIKPGVVVKLATGKTGIIYVEGRIKAEGTADDWIEFTRDGDDDFWGAILLKDTEYGNTFKYCKLNYSAYISPDFEGAKSYYRGLSFHNSGGVVSNCIFYRNKEIQLQCSAGSSPTFKNLTIVHNDYNPAIYSTDDESRPKVKNCIIYKNERSFGGTTRADVSYSLIGDKKSSLSEKIYTGNGMIYNQDPIFEAIDNDDFRLRSGSPCIGAGQYGVDLGAIPYVADESGKKKKNKGNTGSTEGRERRN